jgi:hypothetical protein
MVRRGNDKIGYWHQAPFTQEELEDFWRRYGSGPIAFTRPAGKTRQAGATTAAAAGKATPFAKA